MAVEEAPGMWPSLPPRHYAWPFYKGSSSYWNGKDLGYWTIFRAQSWLFLTNTKGIPGWYQETSCCVHAILSEISPFFFFPLFLFGWFWFFSRQGFSVCSGCPRNFLCRPGWLWTHRNPSPSTFQVLGLKICTSPLPHPRPTPVPLMEFYSPSSLMGCLDPSDRVIKWSGSKSECKKFKHLLIRNKSQWWSLSFR